MEFTCFAFRSIMHQIFYTININNRATINVNDFWYYDVVVENDEKVNGTHTMMIEYINEK